MNLGGKRILVTGAASGIGRATAITLTQSGASVIIADINADGLDETAAMLTRAPQVRRFDASDYDSCAALVDAAAKDGLDALCNVSGILKWGPSDTFSMADFDQVMRINAGSVFALCQAAMPHLIKSRGSIVNTSSTAGLAGLAYSVAYSASKHAVLAITKGLAIEFAKHGVRVNAICPGVVNTPMVHAMMEPPEGVDMELIMSNAPKLEDGACDPEDIAHMFAYLISDKAAKITGAHFVIDGGQMAG